MSGYKKIIEKVKMSDKLMHKIFITADEEKVFLNVEYDGRFKIEKQFKNNVIGLFDMESVREKLDTEEKVLHYLGIGEINE